MSNWRFGIKKRAKLFITRKKFKHNLANLLIKTKKIQELDNYNSNNVSEISNNQVKSYSITQYYNYFKSK
jgi:hypothetical protein